MLNAIARIAGAGVLARSGAKAMGVLRWSLRRRGILSGCADSTANIAQIVRAKRYRLSAQATLDHSKVRVLSVAMDASRVGGKDTLYSALWSCENSCGCWGDPMVLG